MFVDVTKYLQQHDPVAPAVVAGLARQVGAPGARPPTSTDSDPPLGPPAPYLLHNTPPFSHHRHPHPPTHTLHSIHICKKKLK